MRVKSFRIFESRDFKLSQDEIDSMVCDLQCIKDIFQSFEDDWNSKSSEYCLLTIDRRVLKYNEQGLKDGSTSITQDEWWEYYNNKVDSNIWKVKISIPIQKDIDLSIDDSKKYIERVESEGFYFSSKLGGLTSHIGIGNHTSTYYDIANVTKPYYKFLDYLESNFLKEKTNRNPQNMNFYLYFKKS